MRIRQDLIGLGLLRSVRGYGQGQVLMTDPYWLAFYGKWLRQLAESDERTDYGQLVEFPWNERDKRIPITVRHRLMILGLLERVPVPHPRRRIWSLDRVKAMRLAEELDGLIVPM